MVLLADQKPEWFSDSKEQICEYNGRMGCSTKSVENLASTLIVYATICKHEEKPLRFSTNRSSWEQLTNAELVAEQLIWVVSDPHGKNQAFNYTNGNVFRWKRLWKILAKKFELEGEEYRGEGFSMLEAIKEKTHCGMQIYQKRSMQD
eukprot:Gb_19216 [translate_table: standard]